MRRRNQRTSNNLANQSLALRKASKAHQKAGNDWLAKVMQTSSEYFTELNRQTTYALDAISDNSEMEHDFISENCRDDGYIYEMDEDFSSYRSDWFNYNSEYNTYMYM